MKKWLSKQSRLFDKDKNIILNSRLKWEVKKKTIFDFLTSVVVEAKEKGISLYCYDYQDFSASSKRYPTYDGVSLSFENILTGNLIITKEDHSTSYDYKKQIGAKLHVTFNKLGLLLVYITPSTSGDSGAVNPDVNIYTTYNPADVTEKSMRKWVKKLFLYQRCTGVLHHNSRLERLKCYMFRLKGSWMSYLNPDQRFKIFTTVHIPLFALVISIASALIALYPFFTTKQ